MSKKVGSRTTIKARRPKRAQRAANSIDDAMAAAERREIDREIRARIKELDNPVRYALASEFSPRFILYYNVTDDVYVMNEPEKGTLFKRRDAAVHVKSLLSKHTVIIKFTKRGNKLRRLSPFRGVLRTQVNRRSKRNR